MAETKQINIEQSSSEAAENAAMPAAAAAEWAADEPFINAPTGVEARIIALIAPVLEQEQFRLVQVRLIGLNGLTLQIMAERFDGSMAIEDCEMLSQNISPILDVENIIDKHYNLEISSPGMERPLVRKSDFALWAGHLIKIETDSPVEGRKKFRGVIKTAEAEHIIFKYAAKDDSESIIEIPYNAIAEAHLVLTDEAIRAALRNDKADKAAERH